MRSDRVLRVLIVDDESLARETLRLLLAGHAGVEIVGECDNGRDAVTLIRGETPDLVFLDIQMPEMNGFEVIKTIGLEAMPVTVFVTAYDQYALRAFEAQALDYLLKPFDDERFEQALDRARRQIERASVGTLDTRLSELVDRLAAASPTDPHPLDRIMIRERSAMYFVKTDEIDWIEAAGDYVNIMAGGKAHLVRETMNGMVEKLDPAMFLRIHRSYIVHIDRIKEVQPYFHGDYLLLLRDGTTLKLSRRYWEPLERRLGGA